MDCIPFSTYNTAAASKATHLVSHSDTIRLWNAPHTCNTEVIAQNDHPKSACFSLWHVQACKILLTDQVFEQLYFCLSYIWLEPVLIHFVITSLFIDHSWGCLFLFISLCISPSSLLQAHISSYILLHLLSMSFWGDIPSLSHNKPIIFCFTLLYSVMVNLVSFIQALYLHLCL